jgi:uncharacterized membrane protein
VAIRVFIEWISLSIEVLAAVVIVCAIVTAVAPRNWLGIRPAERRTDLFSIYKQRIGRGLLLGLELMLAADILDTIAVQSTIESLSALALLALIRTFLSWSLEVEMEGCWPWRAKAAERSAADESTPARETGAQV